jgi:hypothetical protein
MPLWGNTDTEADKPKYLSSTEKALCFFVDTTEAASDANRAKGIKIPGWVRVFSYTDTHGNERSKVETLVSMAISADDAGDGPDDTVVGDGQLKITQQPKSIEVAEGEDAVFEVVASDMDGSFQWQVRAGGVGQYVNITGATSATLTVAEVTEANNGDKYRCVILNSDGNTSIISRPATLTVLPE